MHNLMNKKKILFVCSRNKWRSPTAEFVFSQYDEFETASAGTNDDAEYIITNEDIEWADIIFVMEDKHRKKLTKNFGKLIGKTKIISLNIPDNYQYMSPDLIALLKSKCKKYLKI